MINPKEILFSFNPEDPVTFHADATVTMTHRTLTSMFKAIQEGERAVADLKRLRSKAMITTRIKEIRDRWAKTTPGEWKCVVDERRSGCGCGTKTDSELLDGTVSLGLGHSPDRITTKLPDALAIASAPDDIRWLCEQVERLEKVAVWMNNLLAGREWNETEKVG